MKPISLDQSNDSELKADTITGQTRLNNQEYHQEGGVIMERNRQSKDVADKPIRKVSKDTITPNLIGDFQLVDKDGKVKILDKTEKKKKGMRDSIVPSA
jgi:hypothetical protein